MPIVELEVAGRLQRVEVEDGFTPEDLDFLAGELERRAGRGAPSSRGGGGPLTSSQPASEPTLEDLAERPEPSFGRRAAAFASRVGLPIVGGVVGGVPGALAGGALGEAAGEWIEGDDLSPARIAVGGGLSILPGIRGAATLSRAARVGLRAAEGAGQGAIATTAETVARTGELPSGTDVAKGAAAGAVLGGVAGSIERRGVSAIDDIPESQRSATRRQTERSGATSEKPTQPDVGSPDANPDLAKGHFTPVPGLYEATTGLPKTPQGPAPAVRIDKLVGERVDALFPWLDDVSKVSLKETITENRGALEAHTRGTQSWDRASEAASELIFDVNRRLPKGTALNDQQMTAVVNTVGSLQEKVTSLADAVRSAPNDDTVKLQLQRAHTQLANAIFSFTGARSEAGRTLNILRRQSDALGKTFDARAIMEGRKLGLDADTIVDVLNKTPDDPLQQFKQLRDLARSFTTPDWLRWYYYSNILSGPKTHARNILGNMVNLGLRPLTTPFAAGVDAATKARQDRTVFARETPLQVVQAFKAVPEAFEKAIFMWRNGIALDDVRGLRTGDFELRATKEAPGGIATNFISRGLGAVDEFFRTIAFNMELHAGAYSEARQMVTREAKGGRVDQKRIADVMADLLDEKPDSLMNRATGFASRSTFQEEAGPFVQRLMQLRDAVPFGSFIVPFVRTPANLFKQGVQFSPAGFTTTRSRGGGRGGAQAKGEAALGTALLFPVAYLASLGQLSGAPPQDRGERDALYATGWRPNSVRIGDQWVSYNSLGPLALPFSTVANLFDAYRAGAQVDESLVLETVKRVGKSLLDQSYLAGLSAFLQAWKEPDRYLDTFLQQTAGGFVPASGLLRNVTQAQDPIVRDPDTVGDAARAIVPGLSEQVQPRLDAFGEPVRRPAEGLSALVVPEVSAVRDDPVRAELQRLGVAPEPARKGATVKAGKQTFELTPEEDLALREARGQLVRVFVEQVMRGSSYERANDDTKRRIVAFQRDRASDFVSNRAKALKVAKKTLTRDALVPKGL